MLEVFELPDILGINPYILLIIIAWSLAWKGIALWKSARKNNVPWFVILFIFNTVGILPILYIFWFSKIEEKRPMKPARKAKRAKAQKKK